MIVDRRNTNLSAYPRLAEITPILAIALMLGLPLLLRTDDLFTEEAIARNGQIAAAINEAPWLVADRWSGRAVPIPVAATRILRPTAILSRRYLALPIGDDDREALSGGGLWDGHHLWGLDGVDVFSFHGTSSRVAITLVVVDICGLFRTQTWPWSSLYSVVWHGPLN